MTGAMQGSTHSLRQMIRTRTSRQRRAAAGRVTAHRYSSHAGEIALIHSDFGHRFHLATQEVCVATRSAMIQRLHGEKEAALARVRLSSATEAIAVRAECRVAYQTRRGFRAASAEFGMRTVVHRPMCSRLGRHRQFFNINLKL
jgi:hypothetical protein